MKSGFIPIILVLITTILTTVMATAATNPIVGSWKKSGDDVLQFKPDGTIMHKGTQYGTWRPQTGPGGVIDRQYIIHWNNDVRLYTAKVTAHDSKLTAVGPNGATSTIDRIYRGATKNPDVPDKAQAMKLEAKDRREADEKEAASVRAEITGMASHRDTLRKEAGAERVAHEIARAAGKISSHLAVAEKKELEADELDKEIGKKRARLKTLNDKLAKKRK